MRIVCDNNCGSKNISTYGLSENIVLNDSYLLPDNMKISKYTEFHDMCVIWSKVSS